MRRWDDRRPRRGSARGAASGAARVLDIRAARSSVHAARWRGVRPDEEYVSCLQCRVYAAHENTVCSPVHHLPGSVASHVGTYACACAFSVTAHDLFAMSDVHVDTVFMYMRICMSVCCKSWPRAVRCTCHRRRSCRAWSSAVPLHPSGECLPLWTLHPSLPFG